MDIVAQTMQKLNISAIRTDGSTQPRSGLSDTTVRDYAMDMLEGDQFPPVVVFFDGTDHWLAAGFHRVAAAQQIGRLDIDAIIKTGTARDAFLFAVEDNRRNGVRYTNADKRAMIDRFLSDAEWRTWSDREIARRTGVHHDTVSVYRRSLSETDSDDQRQYITKHGTLAVMNTANIGGRPERQWYETTCPECGRKFAGNGGQDLCYPCIQKRWATDNATIGIDPFNDPLPFDADDSYTPSGDDQRLEVINSLDLGATQRAQRMAVTVYSSESNEWYTPAWVTACAADVMGGIDLDPASSQVAQRIHGAVAWYGLDHPDEARRDGYAHAWQGNVWLNPPYGRSDDGHNAQLWSRKLAAEYAAGRVSAGILLVKAALGYNWFEELWSAWPVCFLRERLSFVRPDGTDDGQSKQATALLYFGRDVARFRAVFGAYGRVILPEIAE